VAKKRKLDPARTRPLTLEFLRDLGELKEFAPPAGDFDPLGAWTHTYRLWLVQRRLGGGVLVLRREPAKGGVRLTADLAVAEHTGYIRKAKAVVECAADALCTPRAWTLESQGFDADDKPIRGTKVTERGTIANGVLETRFGDRSRKQKVPLPVTCEWSLLDAVQRLPGPKTKPMAFALLEELDLLKPEQRLEFRETKGFTLSERTLPLTGYQQVGRGVLPWQYWVDAQHRLLFAFGGLRAYIYDPTAAEWMQQKLDRARARTRRLKGAKK